MAQLRHLAETAAAAHEAADAADAALTDAARAARDKYDLPWGDLAAATGLTPDALRWRLDRHAKTRASRPNRRETSPSDGGLSLAAAARVLDMDRNTLRNQLALAAKPGTRTTTTVRGVPVTVIAGEGRTAWQIWIDTTTEGADQ